MFENGDAFIRYLDKLIEAERRADRLADLRARVPIRTLAHTVAEAVSYNA